MKSVDLNIKFILNDALGFYFKTIKTKQNENNDEIAIFPDSRLI